MLIGFEHVGMAVADLDRCIGFYVGHLGLRLHLRRATGEGEVAFLDTGAGMLEVFCPAERVSPAQDTPRERAGMRHMTFAVTDLRALWAELEAAGVTMVEAPRPAKNADVFRTVAFCRDPDGILVELVERA